MAQANHLRDINSTLPTTTEDLNLTTTHFYTTTRTSSGNTIETIFLPIEPTDEPYLNGDINNTDVEIISMGITFVACVFSVACLCLFVHFLSLKHWRVVLIYVTTSHLFITCCSYYILIWQFVLFHNAKSDELIPIIVLESIVFAIKFIIDLFVYNPCNSDRNITEFGFGARVLCHDKDWKKDYHENRALGCLFNPLSVSLYICSLTLSFISIYDGPNSNFIEWHSLLLLFILSAINQIIKHSIYKHDGPHGVKNSVSSEYPPKLKVLDSDSAGVELTEYRSVSMSPSAKYNKMNLYVQRSRSPSSPRSNQIKGASYYLTKMFGRNIANLIWIIYANGNHDVSIEEIEYWKSIKCIDYLIKCYYKYHHVEYGYFDSFYHFWLQYTKGFLEECF